MATKPKIIIAMPCTDEVCALTAQSVGASIVGANGAVVDVVMRQSCEIASSRTWLVKYALEQKATHLLFVDSDMVFPHDTIPRMLAHKKDIVAARYHKRRFPLEWTHKPMTDDSESELFEAQYAGTGLMLIDLKIFDKEWTNPKTGGKQPWFNFGRDSQGALVLGEDAWFCNSARDNGFTSWIDPTIKVGHVGHYVY